MSIPKWILEVQAFGPAIIGIGVTFISVQQFRVSARKLRLDLYQRRYEVFVALHNYMTISNDIKEDTKRPDFIAARSKAYEKMAESRFLFDMNTCEYIAKFVENISTYITTIDILRSGQMDVVPEEKARLSETNAARGTWLFSQYEPMVAAFSPSMKLDHDFGFGAGWSKWIRSLRIVLLKS